MIQTEIKEIREFYIKISLPYGFEPKIHGQDVDSIFHRYNDGLITLQEMIVELAVMAECREKHGFLI